MRLHTTAIQKTALKTIQTLLHTLAAMTRNVDEECAREELLEVIERVDDLALGSFATCGQVPNSCNPGLFVEGLGVIGLPISDFEAASCGYLPSGTCKREWHRCH